MGFRILALSARQFDLKLGSLHGQKMEIKWKAMTKLDLNANISYSRSILLLVEKKESGDTEIWRGLTLLYTNMCKSKNWFKNELGKVYAKICAFTYVYKL